MKKYILMALLAFSTLFIAKAESGDMAIAPQLSFATKHSTVGIGAQVQIDINDHLRLAPYFFYYIKNKKSSAYGFDFNVHYLFPKEGSKFAYYPLAGFSYHRYKTEMIDEEGEKYDEKHDRIGANIGVGAQYQIGDMMHLFAEERFQLLKDYYQSVTVLGVRFIF